MSEIEDEDEHEQTTILDLLNEFKIKIELDSSIESVIESEKEIDNDSVIETIAETNDKPGTDGETVNKQETIRDATFSVNKHSDESVFGENIFDKLFPESSEEVSVEVSEEASEEVSEEVSVEVSVEISSGCNVDAKQDLRSIEVANTETFSISETPPSSTVVAMQNCCCCEVADTETGPDTSAKVSDDMKVSDEVKVSDDMKVSDEAKVSDKMVDVNLTTDSSKPDDIPPQSKKTVFKTLFGWLF